MCILSKRILKWLSLLVLMIYVSGCSAQPTIVTNTGCSAFGLIYASRQDTVDTQRQILSHNLTYQEICSG